MSPIDYAARAARMREEFDAAFARPHAEEPPPTEDLLAVRVRGDGFALRAGETAGLARDRKIVPLPGAAVALLGLAGIRGAPVPAWDLGSLLGYPGRDPGSRWLALGRGGDPWALAFDAFDGFFRVPRSDVHPGAGTGPGAAFAIGTCSVGGMARPVVSLPALLEAVRKLSEPSQTRRTRR